ncbi:MAG TPA: hypothetical protein VEY89_00635, partial [Candidatus Dormibacteraeota bacterium]|nr:hypothetical protein [Candidatus Dormibacteraeota bacterium]
MSPPGTASARAQALVDARVAESPLVSLRYFVDTWATDLDELVPAMDRQLADAEAAQSALQQQLRNNEDVRRHVLNSLPRYAPEDVVRCFHDGLSLHAELGRLAEHAATARHRLDAASAERDLIRGLARTLRQLA